MNSCRGDCNRGLAAPKRPFGLMPLSRKRCQASTTPGPHSPSIFPRRENGERVRSDEVKIAPDCDISKSSRASVGRDSDDGRSEYRLQSGLISEKAQLKLVL